MFDNCDGNSCYWAVFGLMALAGILGGIIGWILRGNRESTQTNVGSPSSDNKLSAELNALKGKYANLEKQHASLNTQFVTLKGASATPAVSDDSALKLRIKELEAENKTLKSRSSSAAPATGNAAADRKRRQEAMLAALAAKRGTIDLGRIGAGGPEDKDNLKRLAGLGSLLEKKLNALGIYKYAQIANLTPEDENKLNGLLDLPKDKFHKSGWVLESKRRAGLITEEELILMRVKGRKSWLNYDRIGLASVIDKDELQKINGIGPFIEDKLNALEIYTFSQLSKLTNRDVSLVNDAIELNEGHIDRDDWVGQAKSFLKKK